MASAASRSAAMRSRLTLNFRPIFAAMALFEDFIVTHPRIVLDHHLLDLAGHDGELGVGTGKLADRLERAPFGDDEELNAARHVAPQDLRRDEAVDALDLREGFAAQVLDVVFGALAPRQPAPLARDHETSGARRFHASVACSNACASCSTPRSSR